MSAGSKAKYEESRVGIAESGNGFGPIVPFKVSAPFDATDLLAVFDEPRAASAGRDLTVQFGQVIGFLSR